MRFDDAAAFPPMRNKTRRAVFHAVIEIAELAAAFAAEGVKRAIAEHAVEIFGIVRLVTREIFTGFVLKKLAVHGITSFSVRPAAHNRV